jgi:FAD/FMN-containing dehydrogenase
VHGLGLAKLVDMNDLHHDLEVLKKAVGGDVIVPGDAEYDAASTIMVTKGAPAVVVRPKSPHDVAAAIAFARANQLKLSVRSGGHSNAGHSTNVGGLVIDLIHLKTVEVLDEAKHTVRIGAGAQWGAVAEVLAAHGLGISSGDTRTVGVGGLTLAGGVGWMVRKYGLALDNLLAAEIVTADGRILRASATEEPDLFWAVRGGGGNFGVATSFEFAAHPTGQVYAGMAMYELADVATLLKGWRDLMRAAPEELTTMFLIMPGVAAFPKMPVAAMILFCYAGDDEAVAAKVVDPFLQLGKLMHKDIRLKDYAEVLEDAHPPAGLKVITNNTFIHELTDDAVQGLASAKGLVLQIRSLGGAMNRIAPDATAFAHRDSEVLVVAPTFVAPDATPEVQHEALAPWRIVAALGNGAYISFFSEDSGNELHAAYPPATYERLARIKQAYDPENIFKQNYNIPPAA